MGPSKLLRRVASALEELEIPYFVTGSFATIFFGEPRFTNDIDIVIDLGPAKIPGFLQAFTGDEFYLSEESVREAVRRQSQFNLIHPASGLKVDFMVAGPTPFNRSRFQRARRLGSTAGSDASFASPEDVILKKIEYFRAGGSDKHIRDIAGVLRVSGDGIDHRYLAEWIEKLGLEETWEEISGRL